MVHLTKQIKTNKINILYEIAWHAGFYECGVSIEFDSKSMFSLKFVKFKLKIETITEKKMKKREK
jgi:hypothetical protein